ncbi:MAG: type II toxin-antitoxin system RelE/ParE family toxin [Planctomycetota bacterium]|nr:type II toxin-antitoxin system RelE/ParE family toxin [Planctomycetota bacterium]
MALSVTWTAGAIEDLKEILEYISLDAPAAALKVGERIAERTMRLARYPRSGHRIEEFPDDAIREVVVYSYRVICRILPSEVEILSVIHGGRDLQKAMQGRLRR